MIWKLIAGLLPSFWILTSDKGKSVRERVCSCANRVTGYNAGGPTLDSFSKLLGVPPEGSQWDLLRPFHVDSDGHTTGVSTCGLVTRGIHCMAGINWPEHSKPYIPGRVFTDMENFAMKHGLWRSTGVPDYGDAFIIGTGYQTHMATCIDVDGWEVLSVDGGQVDPKTGLQCITQKSRDFRQVHLQGIINVEGLAALLG